jgi:hypothetical protein
MENKKRVKFPYGISNLEQVATGEYVFVDKTNFIEKIEQTGERFTAFLRPRRFGKSLFLSLLEYYYDINRKEKFDKIFSKSYIGQHPTPTANSFRILKFDFSGIDTRNAESTYTGFVFSVKNTVGAFCQKNGIAYEVIASKIEALNSAEGIIDALFEYYPPSAPPICLLIDEYDHFTNEILLRNLEEFKTSVSLNGYVRKFYEVIKTASQSGVVDRFFITGVSPVTLDALTSGFNIAKQLTLRREFHDVMGFTEEQTRELLLMVLEDKSREEKIAETMRVYYNGYKFNANAENTLYNPDMVLYFLDNFMTYQTFPDEMLDENITPDYGKLKMIFERLKWTENRRVLEEVLREGAVTAKLIRQFNFVKIRFGQSEFVSFLFYLGNLTVFKTNEFGEHLFKIPNQVIKELYWEYYADVLAEFDNLPVSEDAVTPAVRLMAGGNHEAFFDLIRTALKQLSNRDYQKFNEKYVKLLIIAYAVQSEIFFVQSERETSLGGYIDLEFAIQPKNLHRPHYQYVFEIKYLKKENEHLLSEKQEEAENQLKNYLTTDTILKNAAKLRAFTLVVVKDEMFLKEIL